MTSGLRGRIGELAALFLRLGVTAFGGPAAHIAMMHHEVVRRRGWLDDQRFLDLVGATNLIPGPNSTEMTMHIGHERAGWRGLVTAGVGFILPAAAIVLALAWAYVAYGQTPAGEALLYGVKPVIIAIVVQALLHLGRTAITGWLPAAVAVAAAGLYLAGINELIVLAGAALLVVSVRLPRRPTGGPLLSLDGSLLGLSGGLLALPSRLRGSALLGLAPGLLTPAAAVSSSVELTRLFGVFLKIGAVLYGSGYVLLAFLRGDLVVRLGWLTDAQLLDAVAIGQFTPGPVFTTATFVGYVLAGLPGAALATIGIFLPSFLFVAALRRLLPRLRDRAWTAALLDGVNAAALGLMAGVCAQLARDALVDALTVVLVATAGLALWHTRLNSAWLVAAGALTGLLAGQIA